MPQEASKVADTDAAAAAADVVTESSKGASEAAITGDSGEAGAQGEGDQKKSKKKQIKDALTGKGKGKAAGTPHDIASLDTPAGQHLSQEQLQALLEFNPALRNDVLEQAAAQGDLSKERLAELVRKLDINQMLTGLAPGGKNVKDMGSHKFWKTQPVPAFDELADRSKAIVDGPIKEVNRDEVPKEPISLGGQEDNANFQWVTMDLEDKGQLDEVYQLLTDHYVEDTEAMFRFRYSPSFLNWALKAPGWRKEWHVGIRTTNKSRKLVAFISAIPVQLRVRDKVLNCSEVNFLCIHKKLRAKRLTPTLIKEITRRCYVEGVYQAVYTVGSLLPTPVSTCRYFHRALNWKKLYDVGFSPLPTGSTERRQEIKYKLPDNTSLPGLRALERKDIDSVLPLLTRYLELMGMAQVFSREDFEHWMFPAKDAQEQVVWAYVVEDPKTKKITDFVSFYNLESTVIKSTKHSVIKAAYLFYYATESAFKDDKTVLKTRLNDLMHDALILAKKENFDVFNALTLLDNPLFLEQQKFGAGDGSLHYYLYNYRAAPLGGGIDGRNRASDSKDHMRGIGLVML